MSAISKFDMTGKVAVVTGGSRGLGRQMVLAFAEQGADVVIASRKIDNCQAVAREVEALGRAALPIAYHAAEWDAADDLADAVYERFGRCDVLVNNAGMSPLYPSVDAISESLVRQGRRRQPEGSVPTVGEHRHADGRSPVAVRSSSCRRSRRPGRVAQEIVYGAAKAGVNNLTYGLARTFGPTVRVNCIVPGPFLTDISKAWDMDQFETAAQPGTRSNEVANPTRSSAPRCTSPPMHPRTRPARPSRSTAAPAEPIWVTDSDVDVGFGHRNLRRRRRKAAPCDDESIVSTPTAPSADAGAALLDLYDTAMPQIYGYFHRRCRNRATAEDLTTDVFLAAVDSIGRNVVDEVTVAWLIGIARHKLVDHWRRLEREQRRLRRRLERAVLQLRADPVIDLPDRTATPSTSTATSPRHNKDHAMADPSTPTPPTQQILAPYIAASTRSTPPYDGFTVTEPD